MQTVNIDGQEALFIPSSAMSGTSHHQSQAMQFTAAGGQQVQLANGQTLITPHPVSLIRSPHVFPTSIIQNIGGQTVQLPTGKLSIFFVFFFLHRSIILAFCFSSFQIKNTKFFFTLTLLIHRGRYPALGHFSFSNFFKLLLAEI